MNFAATTGRREEDDNNVSAPLYITVGPPCSGKTTWLRRKREERESAGSKFVDICLDEQPYVYISIPMDVWVMSPHEMKRSREHQEVLARSYFTKTVQERLLAEDQTEMRLVLQRLVGKLSAEEFESSLKENTPNGPVDTKQSSVVMKTLVESVESLMGNQTALPGLPAHANLFVLQALFEKDPTLQLDRYTGIERATNQLRQTQKSTTVAWGNTNTKNRDYMVPLQIAQEQNRPVYFCVHGDNTEGESLFDLPKMEFRQLVDRNLQRLIKCGQYVPCTVIMGVSGRADKLVRDAMRNMDRGATPTKLELDRQLARLANFDLKKDRRLVRTQNYDQNGRSHGGRGGYRGREDFQIGRGYNQSRWNQKGGRYYDNRRSFNQGRGRGYNQARVYQDDRGYQGRPGPPRQQQFQPPRRHFNPNGGQNPNLNAPNDPLDGSAFQGTNNSNTYNRYGPQNGSRYGNDNRYGPQNDDSYESRYASSASNYYTRQEWGSAYVPPRNENNYSQQQGREQPRVSSSFSDQRRHNNLNDGQSEKSQKKSEDASEVARVSREGSKRQREETPKVDPWTDVGDATRYFDKNRGTRTQDEDEGSKQSNVKADYHG